MDSMKELKDWLVTKCRLPGFQQTLRPPTSSDPKYGTNVVTPKSIPEFVIPGSTESSRNPSICSSDDLRSHSSGMSVTCSPCTSPAVSPRNSLAGLAVPENKSPVRVRSAPVSPRRDSHGFLRDFGARSLSNLQPNQPRGVEATGEQVNPQSSTAAETSYFKTKNNLGCSLKESPQNRRKEQLHNQLKSDSEHKYHRGFMRRPFRSHECLFSHDASGAACAVPEHSSLSATSSPRRCSPVFTDQNDYLPLRESFRRSQRYYRRRSSLAQVEMTTALWRQNSDLGDSPSRRIPVTTLMAPLHHAHKRHSAPSAAPADCLIVSPSNHSNEEPEAGGSSGVTTSSREDSSAERPQAEQNGEGKLETERGDIKFSFQYFPATRRLKLLLIRAENLHFPERPDIVTNPFFKVSS